MEVNFTPQALGIIEILRSSAERDLGIRVSFNDTVNAVICSFSRVLVEGLGGDE